MYDARINVNQVGTHLGNIKVIKEYVWQRKERDGYLNANREREEELRFPPSIEELEEESEEKRQLEADLQQKITETEEKMGQ